MLDILTKTYELNYLLHRNNTPYKYIFEDKGKYYSLLQLMNDYESLYRFFIDFRTVLGYKLTDNDVLLIFSISRENADNDTYFNYVNKFYEDLKENLIEVHFDIFSFESIVIDQTRKNYLKKWEELIERSILKFSILVKVHEELETLEQSTSRKDIERSLKYNKRNVSFIEDRELEYVEYNIPFIINEMVCTETFPIIRYKNITKIYEKNFKEEYLERLEAKVETNNNLIYILSIIEGLERVVEIDFERNHIYYSFPNKTIDGRDGRDYFLEKFYEFYPKSLIKQNLKEFIEGKFQIEFDDYNENKFYYLCHTDNFFSLFFFVKEFGKPRSIKRKCIFRYRKPGFIEKSNIHDFTAFMEFSYADNGMLEVEFSIFDTIEEVLVMGEILSKLSDKYNKVEFDFDVEVKNKKIVRKKLNKLKKKDYYMFEGTSKVCMCHTQPIIIDEEDIEDWKQYLTDEGNERKVFLYPSEDSNYEPKYNYICPDNKYPYPYIKKRDKKHLSDKHVYVPCCRATPYIPEEIDKEDELVKSRIKHTKTSFNTLLYKQLGILPENLINHLPDNCMRYGASPNNNDSFLYCVLTALSGYNYRSKMFKYVENYSLGDKENTVKKLREEVFPNINLDIVKSENSDLSEDEIKDYIRKGYFDPKRFYKLIEHLFSVNVFMYSENGIEEPYYKKFYTKSFKSTFPTLMFYIYPNHCDLIVQREINKHNFLRISKNYYGAIFYDLENIYNRDYFVINDGYKYFNPYNIDWDVVLSNYKVLGQRLNSNGKTIMINIQKGDLKVSIFTPPSQPLYIEKNKDIEIHKCDDLEEFFEGEWIKGDGGVWYKMRGLWSVFIPCRDVSKLKSSSKNIEETTRVKSSSKAIEDSPESSLEKTNKPHGLSNKYYNILKKSESYIQNIGINQRDAYILLQLCIWIWRIAGSPKIREWKDIIFRDNNKKIGGIKKIPYILPKYDSSDKCIEFLNYYWGDIFFDNKINVSYDLQIKIGIFIIRLSEAVDGLSERPIQTLTGVLEDEHNYFKYNFNKIFLNNRTVGEYLRRDENLYEPKFCVDVIREYPYLLKFNDMYWIVQAPKSKKLKNALYLCKYWRENRVNLGYEVDNFVNVSDTPHLIFERDMALVGDYGRDKSPYFIYAHAKGGYSALLPL